MTRLAVTPTPLTWNGRLPGVAVRAAAASVAENPLRMDVAGFVGFAERGPLDTPVMVEDIGQYRAIFGGDVFLARSKGLPIYAQLPRAVQAFFDNGGRRCYVVRVAGKEARANRFAIPGLVAWRPQADVLPVACPAGSVGRWSDNLQVAAQLHQQPLLIERGHQKTACAISLVGSEEKPRLLVGLAVRVPKANTVQKDDALRLRFDDAAGTTLFTRVAQVTQTGPASGEYSATRTTEVFIEGDLASTVAFATRQQLPGLDKLHRVEFKFSDEAQDEWPGALATSALREIIPPTAENPVFTVVVSSVYADPLVPKPSPNKITPKTLLRLTYENGEVYALRCDAHTDGARLMLTSPTLALTGTRGLQVRSLSAQHAAPLVPTSALMYTPSADALPYQIEFETPEVALSKGDVLRLAPVRREKGVNTSEGSRVYLLHVQSLDWEFAERAKPTLIVRGTELWEQLSPVQVVASNVAARLDVAEMLTFDLTIREGRASTERWRNLRFNAQGQTNTTEAAHRRAGYWQDVLAQPLADTVFSATAPELVQRSTRLRIPQLPPQVQDGEPWLFMPLGMPSRIPLAQDFVSRLPRDDAHPDADDGLAEFDPIALFLDAEFLQDDPDTGRLWPLSVRETSVRANEMIYTQSRLTGRKPTKLHSLYAIDPLSFIAIPDLGSRPWDGCSPLEDEDPPVVTDIDPTQFAPCDADEPESKRRTLNEFLKLSRVLPSGSPPEVDLFQRLNALPDVNLGWQPCQSIADMLVVHRAMINMAAARADVLAVLGVPFGYSYLDAMDWHAQLLEAMPEADWQRTPAQNMFKMLAQDSDVDRDALVPATPNYGDYDEQAALSYAAAYFGWLNVREENTPQLRAIRAIAPEGVVCGMMAARAIRRGPGVAPANISFLSVIGLEPLSDDGQWEELFNRQINVALARPGRFTTLSAYTLSDNPQLLQISVRRMLIFLRKLVLHEGYRFAFESNTERFRRTVQIHFEQLFNQLVRTGSLAGFVVDTSDSLNTFERVERGQFIIEIKVALTYPVEYITITLLRTGDNLLDVLIR
jgi:hypothetical protein